jgi:hypothetical protein
MTVERVRDKIRVHGLTTDPYFGWADLTPHEAFVLVKRLVVELCQYRRR